MGKQEYNMIGGRLCIFDYPLVICWWSDILKIVPQLIQDGYKVENWITHNSTILQLQYGMDFNCHIWLSTVEENDLREAEQERRANIRKAPIF